MERLDGWATCVEQALFGENADLLDDQLVTIVSALVLGARMLGGRASFSDDLQDMLATLVALPGPSTDAPPSIRELQEDVISGRTRASIARPALRDWFFRLASFSQAGAPLALDVPRVAEALRQVSYPPEVDERQPEQLQRYVAVLAARIARLDALFSEFTAELPNPSEVGGRNIEAAVKKVDGLLDHAAAVSKLPAGVDRAVIRQAGRELRTEDVEKVGAQLAVAPRWGKLDLAGKLKVLTGDWYSSAAKLEDWVRGTDEALEKLEGLLADSGGGGSGLDEVRRRLDEALVQVAAAMENLTASAGDGVVE